MSRVITFTVALKKEETGGYTVRCVELPAAISQGETEKEALLNIREAIELVLEELESREIKPGIPLGLIDQAKLTKEEFHFR
jgi:predicted RNase H-like HicB family nuclease